MAPEPPAGEREGGQDGSQPESQFQAHKRWSNGA